MLTAPFPFDAGPLHCGPASSPETGFPEIPIEKSAKSPNYANHSTCARKRGF